MTPKDHPVWNKMAVPTLEIFQEVIREMQEKEAIQKAEKSQVIPPTKTPANDKG